MATSPSFESVKFYRDSALNSYGQIFFSNTRGFSILLLIASFADPQVGLCGLLSLIIAIIFSQWLGLNEFIIRSGGYGYNSLLMGFVVGVFYQINFALLVILFFSSVLTLFLTVWLASFLAGYKLPYLSIPFILGVWVILLSSRNLESLHLSERGIYSMNELWDYGGSALVFYNQKISSIHLPLGTDLYFKSLGAIIFQYNLISGILVAIGLLMFSRIAFSLSLVGFYFGYLFCYFILGNVPELEYSYFGFNFILTAIALGGFFIIPSVKSYMLVIVAMPLIGLLMSACNRVMLTFLLPVYSLPFSIMVILIISALRQRAQPRNLSLTEYQEFSPERNLYSHHTRLERFRNNTLFHINLPFFGAWRVSQGHGGSVTHKEEWQYAFDFDVVDELGNTFRLPGKSTSDFYCFGLPILAPAAGQVVTLEDNVEDNPIGEVNLIQNWGNTIVIKHSEFLYSKLSHLRKGSFKVNIGDHVNAGDVLGMCGNSGRSPEPHLHFQLQATPHIGSKTIDYPISYFVSNQEGKYRFHSFIVPEERQIISKPVITPLLKDAFRFTPGLKMKFKVSGYGNKTEIVEWEVFVDAYNQSYIYCHTTGACAWFTNNETLHYFIDFKGSHESLLYYFYLGAYKVLLGYYPNLIVEDALPLDNFYKGIEKTVQDFLSPFYIYLKANFQLTYEEVNNADRPSSMRLISSVKALRTTQVLRKIDFELSLNDHSISSFKVTEGNLCIIAELQG